MKKQILGILLILFLPIISIADDKPPRAEVPQPPPVISEDFIEQEKFKADVTIRKGEKKIIEEYRVNGQLYMVRVIPKVGKPYLLRYPEGANGRVVRRELSDIDTPFWTLFEW